VTLNSASLPYATNNGTVGHGNDYSNTCLGSYDSGEDIIYELNVTETLVLSFTLDPQGTPYTGMLLSRGCPPDGECIAKSINAGSNPHGFEYVVLRPGVYTLMIDKWLSPPGISSFELTISNADPRIRACCLGTNCSDMTLAACLDSGGRWYGANHCSSACPTAQDGNCESPIVLALTAWNDISENGVTWGNAYAGTTCLGVFDGGQETVYQLAVGDDVTALTISLNVAPYGIPYDRVRMVVSSTCPPTGPCWIGDEWGFIENLAVTPGTYYLMIDEWPSGPNYDHTSFDLTIEPR
jgi:hypothetical protein